MTPAENLHDQALLWHQRLPERLWKYLDARGIPDPLIHKYLLGWDGRRITIPIPGRDGTIAFFKLAKDPEEHSDSPKMLATPGARAELYGWERVLSKPDSIIICEGEFDRLVLEAQGFAAVTSTGGAMGFRPEWAEAFSEIPCVYICLDNDDAGRAGSERIGRLVPHARIVRLPEDIGDAGDVTDFFGRLGKSRDEFIRLLEAAGPLPQEKPDSVVPIVSQSSRDSDDEAAIVKSRLRIENLIARYIPLRRSGKTLIARCPFHDDRNPSLVIYPETQSFYCFGCQASGDALSFLMKVEHLSFPEALTVLRRLAA